jgi:hypothetical protein
MIGENNMYKHTRSELRFSIIRKGFLLAILFLICSSIFSTQFIEASKTGNIFGESKIQTETSIFKEFTTERTNWNLTHVGFIEENEQIHELCIRDGYLYLLYRNGFKIIDITKPWEPEELSSYYVYSAIKIECINDYVYVVNAYDGLTVVNVTDKTNPIGVSVYKDVGNASYKNLFIIGTKIYISDGNYGIKILDGTDLSSISLLGVVDFENNFGSGCLWITGNYAFYGNNYGLHIIDITIPSFPITLSNITDIGYPEEVIYKNNLIYLSTNEGFFIFDVTDKENPFLRDDYGYFTNYGIHDFVLNGSEAILTDTRYNRRDLHVLNISNPDAISSLFVFDLEAESDSFVSVYEECIYTASSWNNIEIISYDNDCDTLADLLEIEVYGSDPNDKDTDDDLMPDNFEAINSLDPTDPLDAEIDQDIDGLSNLEEYYYNTNPNDDDTDDDALNDGIEVQVHFTDPLDPDSDDDHLWDGEEIIFGTNPLKSDTDDDLLTDSEEVYTHSTDPLNSDTDADLLSDYEEIYIYYTNPLLADTDGDGLIDGKEILLGTDPLVKDNPRWNLYAILIILAVTATISAILIRSIVKKVRG